MAYPTIGTVSEAGQRGEDKVTFTTKTNAFLADLPTFVTEVNAAGEYIETKAGEVEISATSAATSATNALNAQNAAENASNAEKWVTGTAYLQGDVTWSPTDFQTYRAKTNHTSVTDPYSDTTNWAMLPAGKQNTLVSGTNIKTVHGQSILGSGDTSYLKATATTLSDNQCYIPFLPALSTSGQLVYLDTLLGFDATKNQLFTNHTPPRVSLTGTAIDLSGGQYFYKTISGATTLTISNPSTSFVNAFVLELINGGSSTVTWFSNITWAGGTAPTLTASGTDIIGFISRDGTNWLGFKMGLDMKAGA